MLKRPIIYLLAFVGAIAIAGIAGWVFLASRGFSSRAEPSRAEVVVARGLRRIATPREAREAANPVAASPEILAEGMAHFADHCAFCHANDGSGESEIGRALYPKAPDMRLPETQSLADGELFYIIENGVPFTGMPAFGTDGENDEDSWKLVHFIRHLPELTAEELRQMEEMNPRSPAEFREEEENRRFLEGEDPAPSGGGHSHH